MNIKMIWLEMAEYGDMGRFGEIPELETGHFVDDDGIVTEVIEDIEGRSADVADKVSVFLMGVE